MIFIAILPGLGHAAPLPSASLEALVKKIEAGLSIANLPDGSRPPLIGAPAASLKTDFVAQRVTASATQRQILDAAIHVFDIVTAAVDEKHKTAERMVRSGAFHGRKVGSTNAGPQGNERFFASDIIADWKKRRAELVAQVNQAFTRLKVLEAATQK